MKEHIKHIIEMRDKNTPWKTISKDVWAVFGLEFSDEACRSLYRRHKNKPKKKAKKKFSLPAFEVVRERPLVDKNDRILFISDMHIPYHHPDTFAFLAAAKKKYKPTRVVCVGDEVDCFPEDAEILTELGWKTFRELLDSTVLIKVAQWHNDEEITFVSPSAYVDKPFDGELLRIEHSTYLSMTTERHSIIKINPKTGAAHRREAWDTQGTDSWQIPRFGKFDGMGVNLTEDQLRLQVAFQADGTFDKGAVKWGFTKERKIERMRELLTRLDLLGSELKNSRGDTVLRIFTENTPDFLSKTFDPTWVRDLSADQRRIVLDELFYWDSTPTDVGFRYSCTLTENVNFVQALAASSGYHTSRATDHYVTIHLERSEKTSQKSATHTKVPYKGNVCCVQVPTGMIVVRQEGFATVSGNCHAMSFHDSDPDLPSAGDELQNAIKYLKELYVLFPEMDLVDSNHGSMVYRKGKHHGIPRKYLREYGEVLEAPKGWVWHHDLKLILPTGEECYVHHGLSKDVIKVVTQRGTCVVQGHYHTEFKITYAGNPQSLLWGMNVGCSIDGEALAFAYDRTNLGRPVIGHGICINGLPQLLPMVLNEQGRWTGDVP